MGARPLRRAIQRYIEDPLADFVLGRQLEPGSTILVARKNDEEVDITVVPPAPPEAIGVGAAPDAPPGRPHRDGIARTTEPGSRLLRTRFMSSLARRDR